MVGSARRGGGRHSRPVEGRRPRCGELSQTEESSRRLGEVIDPSGRLPAARELRRSRALPWPLLVCSAFVRNLVCAVRATESERDTSPPLLSRCSLSPSHPDDHLRRSPNRSPPPTPPPARYPLSLSKRLFFWLSALRVPIPYLLSPLFVAAIPAGRNARKRGREKCARE